MEAQPLVRIDRALCERCGACRDACPHRLLAEGPDGLPSAEAALEALCISCGHCAAICPAGALSHRNTQAPLPAAPVAPGAEHVLVWLRGRRSVRRYRAEPIAPEVVRALLEAARYAPTGHNARAVGCLALLSEPERLGLRHRIVSFYRRLFRLVGLPVVPSLLSLVLGPRAVRELRDAAPSMARVEARLAEGEDPLFHGAPALLLFHAPAGETAETDCALAAGQVTLLAPSLGLGTCHIGYASAVLKRFPRIVGRLGVPAADRVYAVLAAGHPARSFAAVPARPEVAVRFR